MTVLKSDGRFDLSEDGNLIFRDTAGEETSLSLEKAFESLKGEFAWAFKASEVGGSGANNNSNASGNGGVQNGLSAGDRLKAHRRSG
jgi:hypothetical protein